MERTSQHILNHDEAGEVQGGEYADQIYQEEMKTMTQETDTTSREFIKTRIKANSHQLVHSTDLAFMFGYLDALEQNDVKGLREEVERLEHIASKSEEIIKLEEEKNQVLIDKNSAHEKLEKVNDEVIQKQDQLLQNQDKQLLEVREALRDAISQIHELTDYGIDGNTTNYATKQEEALSKLDEI